MSVTIWLLPKVQNKGRICNEMGGNTIIHSNSPLSQNDKVESFRTPLLPQRQPQHQCRSQISTSGRCRCSRPLDECKSPSAPSFSNSSQTNVDGKSGKLTCTCTPGRDVTLQLRDCIPRMFELGPLCDEVCPELELGVMRTYSMDEQEATYNISGPSWE